MKIPKSIFKSIPAITRSGIKIVQLEICDWVEDNQISFEEERNDNGHCAA